MSLGVLSITQNPGCLTAAVSTIQESEKLNSNKSVLKANVYIHLASCQFNFLLCFNSSLCRDTQRVKWRIQKKISTLFKNEAHLAWLSGCIRCLPIVFFFFLNGYIIKMMYVGSISSLKYFIFLRELLKSVKIQRQVRDLGLNTNPDKGHMLLRKSVHLSGCHILFLYLPFHPGQVFEQLLMMHPERKLDRLVGRKEAPSTTDHQAECGHCALDPLCFP